MAAASQLDLEINQGATYTLDVPGIKTAAGADVNITGYAVRGQIRRRVTDSVVLVPFTCTIVTPAVGAFQISLTAAQTAALPSSGSKDQPLACAYDVEIESPSGVVSRVLEGTAFISPEVTR